MSTPPKIGSSLSKSIGVGNLTNGLTMVADAGINAAVTALSGVPVLGALCSFARAGFEIKQEIEFQKVVKFLEAVSETTDENRAAFTAKLDRTGKAEEFGQNILLLLGRLDDMAKPRIVGKIISAHINGHIDITMAMRLSAIIDRCYLADLEYLRNFKPGTQGKWSDIAAMLCSAGLLANVGLDGGSYDDPESGGIVYGLNQFAEVLLTYGLPLSRDEQT
jgi:hypothetical protein